MRKLRDCPVCLFSSGYMPFMGSGRSQKCGSCKGTGRVTKMLRERLLKELKRCLL